MNQLLFHFSQELNERTEVRAKNGSKWLALDVFAKCLEYLKKISTDAVNERHLRSQKDNPGADVMYKPEQIQWVITIPAIWSVSAKEFMRKAAYKVISDLKLTLLAGRFLHQFDYVSVLKFLINI